MYSLKGLSACRVSRLWLLLAFENIKSTPKHRIKIIVNRLYAAKTGPSRGQYIYTVYFGEMLMY